MMIWIDKKIKILYFFLFLMLFELYSCGERTLIRHYYILDVPEEKYESEQDSLNSEGICEILRVRIPPAYDQLRIAVRRRSHEISYYQYNYWAMNPADNLTSLLERQIQHSHIFNYSSSKNLKQIPNFQISTEVYRLEAEDIDDDFYVHLEMRMDLIEYNTGKKVLNHQFEKTAALESRDLNLFASELSHIYFEESKKFIKKIRAYLENRKVQVQQRNN
jgi:ABC-type uncharacterized transport system auxiliary subunit